jgi:hypothetical protein
MPLPAASEENANDWQDGSPLYSQSASVYSTVQTPQLSRIFPQLRGAKNGRKASTICTGGY